MQTVQAKMRDQFTKQRVVTNEAINLDAFGAFERNLRDTSHFVAYSKINKTVGAVLHNKSMQKAIRQGSGEYALKQIMTIYQEMKNPSVATTKHTTLGGVMDAISKNIAPAYLAGNFKTILKQVGSIGAFMSEVSLLRLIKELPNIKNNIKLAEEMSGNVKYRQLDQSVEIVRNMIKEKEFSGTKSMYNDFMNILSQGIGFMDKITVATGFMAKYNEQMEIHNDHDKAVRAADAAVADTQVGGGLQEMTDFQKSHEMKVLTMFSSQLFKNFNIFVDSAGKIVNGMQMLKQGEGKAAAKQFLSALSGMSGVFIGGMIVWIISNGKTPDPEDEEEVVDFILGSALTSALPAIGGWVQSATSGFRREAVPLVTMIQGITEAIIDTKDVLSGDKEADINLLKSIVTASGAAGAPSVMMNRILKAYEEGDLARVLGYRSK